MSFKEFLLMQENSISPKAVRPHKAFNPYEFKKTSKKQFKPYKGWPTFFKKK